MAIKEAKKINGFTEKELIFKIKFLKSEIKLNELHLEAVQSEDEEGEAEGWIRCDKRSLKTTQELLNNLQKEND